MAITSFTVGVFANQVPILSVGSLGGSNATIPAPNLLVVGTGVIIFVGGTGSLTGNVTGVNLNVTTFKAPAQAAGLMDYAITVKLQCLFPGNPAPMICATGTASTILPDNMSPSATTIGTTAIVTVPLTNSVDPSMVEMDKISVIAQASPVPTSSVVVSYCGQLFNFGKALTTAGQSFGPNPPLAVQYFTNLTLNGATSGGASFYLRLDSLCGFTGNVTLTPSITPLIPPPNGSVVTLPPSPPLSPLNVIIPAGGTVLRIETVNFGFLPGTYNVIITACAVGTSVCHSVGQIFHVQVLA